LFLKKNRFLLKIWKLDKKSKSKWWENKRDRGDKK